VVLDGTADELARQRRRQGIFTSAAPADQRKSFKNLKSFKRRKTMAVKISGVLSPSLRRAERGKRLRHNARLEMTDHYDSLEKRREPTERDAGPVRAPARRLAPGDGGAGPMLSALRGIDPAAIIDFARRWQGLPVLRKSDPAGLAQGRRRHSVVWLRVLPVRSDACLPSPRADLRGPEAHPFRSLGAARGHCSPLASGGATWC